VDFASGSPVSIDDIVAAMARTLDVAITVRHEGTVAEYIEFRSADTTMRDRYGVVPSIPFDEGLRRLAEFFQEQPAS
jgi:nucleoside-diphosphate-sugar epimerase